MKLITKDTDYAVRAVVCMAGSRKKVVAVKELAEELDISKPFLRKVLQLLNKKGLLRSYKGKNGGFALKVDPGKITIFNLIKIFQGEFRLKEHNFKGKICSSYKTCYFRKRMDKIEGYVVKELKAITIRALVREK